MTTAGGLDFSLRFKLVNALPAAMITGVVGGLVLSGAPQQAPSFDLLVNRVTHYEWFGAVAAVAILIVGALLLEPLEISSLRLLEGYWSATGPLAWLGEVGRWRQECQRSRQRFLSKVANVQEVLEEQWPAGEHDLLPTALGNRMRAFELHAGKAYGWDDIIRLWPRLYYVLPESSLAVLNKSRDQLDVACRLCLSMLLTAAISAGLLVGAGWWLLLPVVLLAGAWLSYRSALAAAVNYGISLQAIVDVHHLELHRVMRLRMPSDTAEERDINGKLHELWHGATFVAVEYADEQGSALPDLYPG